MAPMAAPAAVASVSAAEATPSAIPTRASSRSRVPEVEAEDLGQDGGEGRAVRDLAARPDRVPQRVDEPDARAARLADPGEVRGHQHLRARLEVGAVGDGPAQPGRRPSG